MTEASEETTDKVKQQLERAEMMYPMKREYQQMNDRLHDRVCDIAGQLGGDDGFARYFDALRLARFVLLIRKMKNDDRVSKAEMGEMMCDAFISDLDGTCASASWAAYLDVDTDGALRPDEFLDEKDYNDA